MFPTPADYRRLALDRQRRFVDLLPRHAESLVREAIAEPGVEATALLGRELPTRCVAYTHGDLLELLVAFPATSVTEARVHLALAALAGNADPLWEPIDEIAGDSLSTDIGFRLYRSA